MWRVCWRCVGGCGANALLWFLAREPSGALRLSRHSLNSLGGWLFSRASVEGRPREGRKARAAGEDLSHPPSGTTARTDGRKTGVHRSLSREVARESEEGLWSEDFQEFSLRMRADTQDGTCNIFTLQVFAPPPLPLPCVCQLPNHQTLIPTP